MRRWVFAVAFGLGLGLAISWIDLPFQGPFYNLLMRLRGPLRPNPEITIVTFPKAEKPSANRQWLSQLKTLLEKLSERPPRVVVLDFDINRAEYDKISPGRFHYPVITHGEISRQAIDAELLFLIGSPETADDVIEQTYPEKFLIGAVNSNLVSIIAPEKVRKLSSSEPRLINIAGPPGTYRRVPVERLLSDAGRRKALAGKIVLVAPPPVKPHAHLGSAPFFPSRGSLGEAATELEANAIDSVVRERTIRIPPARLSALINAAVAAFVTAILFATSPILGILAVILVLALLFLAALISINHLLFIDISKPVFTIGIIYYFLIPYRLIVEYKEKWRYRQENKFLSEVETLKDNFMSLVSHNLKTPIARIQGTAETLLSAENTDPQKIKAELSNILHATDDLHRFVSRILSLTRVEHQAYQVRMANKDINAILEKVVEIHRHAAGEKEISVTLKPEPLFPLLMNEELIRESISNLVDNAVKYTPRGGSVEISSSEAGGWVAVAVSDSGPGVAPEDREKIFSKFYRGAEVKNKGIRGSGLGLYLVKYFVELHGGSVEVASRQPHGAVFTLRLPRK